MAKKIVSAYTKRKKVKRSGVHSKSQTSGSKSSKGYKKPYRGQGR